MSVFGFGSSYDPNSYSSGAPASTIAQTVPGYQGSSQQGPGGVDWDMSANNPLTGWGTMVTGYDVNQHGGVQGMIDQMNGNSAQVTPERRRMAYNNPLNGLFGQGGMVNFGDNQAGQYEQPLWSNQNYTSGGGDITGNPNHTGSDFTHQVSGNNPGTNAFVNTTFHNEQQLGMHAPNRVTVDNPFQYYAGNPYQNEFANNANDPNSFQGLYSRMNNLSDQELQGLSNNIGSVGGADSYRAGGSGAPGSGIFGAFQQAQQNVMNNYANGQYRSSAPMSQQDSLNWLQASYNTLTSRLNSGGML